MTVRARLVDSHIRSHRSCGRSQRKTSFIQMYMMIHLRSEESNEYDLWVVCNRPEQRLLASQALVRLHAHVVEGVLSIALGVVFSHCCRMLSR